MYTSAHELGVLEHRVLLKMFGPKMKNITREWKKLHNEKLHDFHLSSNITIGIKSRRMRRLGLVTRKGARTEMLREFWRWSLRESDNLKNHGVSGSIILKSNSEKQYGMVRVRFIWLRVRKRGGFLWIRRWTFALRTPWRFTGVTEEILASEEAPYSSKLNSYMCHLM